MELPAADIAGRERMRCILTAHDAVLFVFWKALSNTYPFDVHGSSTKTGISSGITT